MLWAVLVWQESSLSYHRNLTVKRVMPLRDYKAQYSVIIYRYISFVLKKSFCNELELDKLSRTVVSNAVAFPPVPPKNSFFPFISFCTKNTSLKRRNGWRNTQNKLTSRSRTRRIHSVLHLLKNTWPCRSPGSPVNQRKRLWMIKRDLRLDNFSIKHFGLWSIVLALIYTDTVFVHSQIYGRTLFTYGVNVRARFHAFFHKGLFALKRQAWNK